MAQAKKSFTQSERETLAAMIGQVFTLIQRVYPGTWETSWAGAQELKESQRFIWRYLEKTGLMPTEAGLERLERMMMARQGDFAPQLPDVCRALLPVPEDYGFLSAESAWQLLLKNSHQPEVVTCPAIRLAMAGKVFDLRMSNQKGLPAIRKEFFAKYMGVINRVMRGEELRSVQALEHQQPEAGSNTAHPRVEENLKKMQAAGLTCKPGRLSDLFKQ